MNYQETLDYLDRFVNYEKRPVVDYSAATYKLDRVEQLLARLGNPHLAYPAVLIAGSKGKGSTAAMLAAVMQAAGLRTGFYSKPHLHTFRERVRVDERLIFEEELAAIFTEQIKPAVDEIEAEGDASMVPTYFELSAVLGFVYFARRAVDIAVVEVGMGGRLDATNVVAPLVSVITPISFEHTAVLGDTLAKIAFEKAGIVKRGGMALIAHQPQEADEVFARVCQERGATLVRAEEMAPVLAGSVKLVRRDDLPAGRKFGLVSPGGPVEVYLPLLGGHQVSNAQTAICAFELLCGFGPLPQAKAGGSDPAVRGEHGPNALVRLDAEGAREVIRRGLAAVQWPGRLEIVARSPLVVVDGAHNGDSALKLRQALQEDFGLEGRQVLFVFGANSDKDVEGIVRELAPLAAQVVLTPLQSARSASPAGLRAIWEQQGIEAVEAQSAEEAVETATRLAQERGSALICATGSLYLVGEVRDLYGLSLGRDR